MLFVSIPFLIFFIVVFIVFYAVNVKYRKAVLLISSIFYIYTFSVSFIFYVAAFTLINFYIGKKLNVQSGKKRKYLYYSGQIFNIGGLAFFKYINFIIENVNYPLRFMFGNGQEIPYLSIIAPIGISYYTFQGISYLYLIYKAKDKPETDIVHFSVYMVFFPKLLAGPIERHRQFLPQLKADLQFDYGRIVSGGRLAMWGMFKKIVVGDLFAIILTKVYGGIDKYEGIPLLIAFFIQPVQIYFDFSGYTDMALGMGRMFGIKLTDNFNRPFMARSVSEFWRRWHISLSSWFNDFVYNRLIIKHRKWGNNAVIYAIFVSFLLIGLWHGAKWTFVFLGLLQVVALIYEFKTRKRRAAIAKGLNAGFVKWFSRLSVYLFFCFTLIFFFAQDMTDVAYFLKNMFSVRNLSNTHFGFNVIRWEFFTAIIFAFLLMLWDVYKEDWNSDKIEKVLNNNTMVRWTIYLTWLLFIIYFSKNQTHFVYMQF
jgi:D-alanyl-lipoteichoic acid acyltransferase DltB (MBOAT superfamily)